MHLTSRCVLIVAVALAVMAAADTVRHVTFLHRHGARQEPQVVGDELSWRYADLTRAGEIMTMNLGALLRTRYNDLLSDVDSYDPREVVSVTTDMSRTVRSGFGVLEGLFPSNRTAPYMDHTPMDIDYELAYFRNFPSYFLRLPFRNAFLLNAQIAMSILGQDGINTIAKNFGPWCHEKPTLCAIFAQDCTACRVSNGNCSAELRALYPQLNIVRMMRGQYFQFYDANNTYHKMQGSDGYEVISQWLQQMEQFIGGADPVKVRHFSAHDTTLIGMHVTLGAVNTTLDPLVWYPHFAQTLIAELRDNNIVHFFYAIPDEDHGSGYEYGPVGDFVVSCIDAGGRLYKSSSCPLDDVKRFVETSRPQSPNGKCFVTYEDAAHAGCAPNSTAAPPPECVHYRTYCPQEACTPPLVLDVANGYRCAPVPTPPATHNYAAAYALWPIGGCLVGVALGAFLFKVT